MREFSFLYRDYTADPAQYRGLIERRFSRDRKQPGLGEAAFWTGPGYPGRNRDLVVFAAAE
ncbi:hypothetical protein BH09ACT13_BH09ACT13_01570 [soil metagenome]